MTLFVLPAAAADVVVIRHVYVEHQLLLQSLEAPRLHSVVLVGLQAANKEGKRQGKCGNADTLQHVWFQIKT